MMSLGGASRILNAGRNANVSTESNSSLDLRNIKIREVKIQVLIVKTLL
jgi:hypothetical protein